MQFNAPKWVALLSVAPFFLYAMTLGDPDESLLGDASAGFRRGTLVVVAAGGLVMIGVIYVLWQVFFPADR